MSREDKDDLKKFIDDNKETNCRFACIECSDEQYFKWSNDATDLGGLTLNNNNKILIT